MHINFLCSAKFLVSRKNKRSIIVVDDVAKFGNVVETRYLKLIVKTCRREKKWRFSFKQAW